MFSKDFSNQMISEARAGGRGKNLFLEIIKFFLVFFITEGILSFLLDVVLANALSNSTMQSVAFLVIDILGIAIIILFCKLIEKRPLSSLGLSKKGAARKYLRGLLLGLIIFSAVYFLGCLLGAYHFKGIFRGANPVLLFVFLIAYLIQGMYEELMCRGFLMISISRKHPAIVGVVVSSLAFVLIHMSNEGFGLLPAINLFLFGVFTALLCLYTDNIWSVSAFHAMWNFAEGNLFGLSVSGMLMPQRLFLTEITDRVTISGGLFGPEGGLAVTFITAISIICLMCVWRKKKSSAL